MLQLSFLAVCGDFLCYLLDDVSIEDYMHDKTGRAAALAGQTWQPLLYYNNFLKNIKHRQWSDKPCLATCPACVLWSDTSLAKALVM